MFKSVVDMDWYEREKEEIKLDEGLRLKAYQDPYGVWTIGYGHTGTVVPGSTVTKEQALEDLSDDLDEALIAAKRVVSTFSDLDGPRKGILVNMAFNMGEHNLDGFVNTIHSINSRNFEDAAKRMQDSLWFKQVGPRAERLVYRMRTGKYKDRS